MLPLFLNPERGDYCSYFINFIDPSGLIVVSRLQTHDGTAAQGSVFCPNSLRWPGVNQGAFKIKTFTRYERIRQEHLGHCSSGQGSTFAL